MSLAQRLKEAKEAALAVKLSPMDAYAESLDETDRAALFDTVAAGALTLRALHEAVVAEGVKIGRDRFGSWAYANGYPRK